MLVAQAIRKLQLYVSSEETSADTSGWIENSKPNAMS